MSDRTSGCPNSTGLEMRRPRDEARTTNATNSLTIVTEFVAIHLPTQEYPAKCLASAIHCRDFSVSQTPWPTGLFVGDWACGWRSCQVWLGFKHEVR